MKYWMMGAITFFFSALPSVASAQAIAEKDLLSAKVKIEAESGYIFAQAPVRLFVTLLRVADAETIAAYEADWTKELAKAQEKYPTKFRLWAFDHKKAQEQGRQLPPKPVEPTAENFAIDPIEFRDPVSFGPQFVFAKSEAPESYSYLTKVKPGRYVFYGRILSGQNGPTGICYCMGTVAFDVKAGVITDIWNLFLAGSGIDPRFSASPNEAHPAGFPDSLKFYQRVTPEFRAHGKLDNIYGVIVERMPPVPGVLAYDRDRVIDLKAAESGVAVDDAAVIAQ